MAPGFKEWKTQQGKQDEYTQDNWWPPKAADKKGQRQFKKGEINEAGELGGRGRGRGGGEGPERAGAAAASLCIRPTTEASM